MQELEYNGYKIKLYDSIEDLPIVNYHKYNRYLLLESGIGSSIEDIDAHIIKIAKLIGTDAKKAVQELQNMRQSIYMANSELSPKNLAFAALIYSINGEKVNDYSEDNLKHIVGMLNEVPQSLISRTLGELKKKLSEELSLYFPSEFGMSAREKEDRDDRERYAIAVKKISNSESVKETPEEIEARMIGRYRPLCFYGKDSVEIGYNKQFESSCLLISQKANAEAKSMTTLCFYNALDIIKKQTEAEVKAYKKR